MALEQLGIQAVAAGVPQFVRDLGSMDKAISGTGDKAEGLTSRFLGLGNNVLKFGSILGGAVVGSVAALGGAFAKLAFDAAPLEGVQQSFDNLAASAGKGGAEMLSALQRGSAGLIENRDLMTSFNKAASLVSLDFATKLPDSMEYIGKVAAATGQDFGFLLDSLVTGVGRLSPMILDNLGIQVSLSEAVDRAAQMFGVESSALTKAQQQAGLFAVVQDKLAATTAALPDVVGTAAQIFGSLGIILRNLKDELGLALLPAFKDLATGITPLIQQYLPVLVELFKEKIVPAVQTVIDWIMNVINAFADAGPASAEFFEALTGLLPQNIQDKVLGFIDLVRGIWERGFKFVVDHKDEILSFITAVGVALGGAALAATILKIASVISALSNPISLILTVVGLLYAAWTQNWLGIRDVVMNFWERTGRPIFEQVVKFLQDNIPKAIAAVSGFFQNLGISFGDVGGPALGFLDTLKGFAETLLGPLIPAFQTLFDSVGRLFGAFSSTGGVAQEEFGKTTQQIATTILPTLFVVIQNLVQVLTNLVRVTAMTLDSISSFWEAHGETIIRVVGFLARFIIGTIQGIVALVTGLWAGLTSFLTGDTQGAVDAILRSLAVFFNAVLSITGTNLDEFTKTWENVFEGLAIIVEHIFQGIIDGIVGFVSDLKDGLVGGVQDAINALGDFLGLGSPSKLFATIGQQMMQGLAEGITGAAQLPTIATQAAAGATVAAAQTSTVINNTPTLNLTSAAPKESVIASFEMMRTIGGA